MKTKNFSISGNISVKVDKCENHYIFCFLLPGVKEKNINITINDDNITVEAIKDIYKYKPNCDNPGQLKSVIKFKKDINKDSIRHSFHDDILYLIVDCG